MDLSFSKREDAVKVLEAMQDKLAVRGFVSVGDLYVLCSIEPKYADDRKGWSNLEEAAIAIIKDQVILHFPQPRIRGQLE